MTAMDTAKLQAFGTLQDAAGVDVTYRRGVTSATITAVPGETTAEVVDEAGTMTRSKVRDFLILRSDLVAEGFDEPERGDVIERTIDGTTYTHEVHGPGGDAIFRWWDTAGQVFRIHTVTTGAA